MNFRTFLPFAGTVLALAPPIAPADEVGISIEVANPTVELSPHLYGLFFEDINYAADGGIYAELVQNRSFEYYPVDGNDPLGKSMHPLYAWDKVERDGAVCSLEVTDASPLNDKNTKYLEVVVPAPGVAGVRNRGFDGIRLDAGASYDFSVYARVADWKGDPDLRVALELPDGTVCGAAGFAGLTGEWRKFEGVLTSDATTDVGRLVVTVAGAGKLDLDMVSLFPQDTWKGRKGGLRKDLVQALADLNPKFLRFPGGCIAHGHGLGNLYRWKDTVGDVAERKPNWNLWGYHQTYGLGYFEYFQLCEDLGMHPLPVVPVGVSCGFRGPQQAVPMDQLGTYVQDALDLIEFATGPADSPWGSVRAGMGHPEPFDMEFICLGNEPHDNALFRDRFPPFVKAIREKHPEIKIIGTSGLEPEIPIYDLMTEQQVYSSDEHYYKAPTWFIEHQNRFDGFDRSKPKIFIGEYASRDRLQFNAVAEAAYLTGVERNADMVDMTCYAPLFGNVHHSQWHPDLIYFDKRTVVRTPSYYVQQMFARNKGDVYLPSEVTMPEKMTSKTLSGSVGIGSWLTSIEVARAEVNGERLDFNTWKSDQGRFEVAGGHLIQTDLGITGAVSMSPATYDGDGLTYSVRIRKTGGSEGFLIVFGGASSETSYWLNVGGWDNSRHALQSAGPGERSELASVKGKIETGRWYDVKIELKPGRIECYLDGKLILQHDIRAMGISVSSTLEKDSGDVILKLVNPTDEAADTRIRLDGAGHVAPDAVMTSLAGKAGDENTVLYPDRVRTETRSIRVAEEFAHTLPAMSVQFIRVRTK